VDAQISALRHVADRPSALATPRIIPCLDGAPATRVGEHEVCLESYLPGRPLAEFPHLSPGLLRELGRGLGELDARLESFTHPALKRPFRWDLRQASRALEFVGHVEDAAGRESVRERLEQFESEILPIVDRLPFQSIHNDANDHNVLVLESGEARLGLVDFGDIVWTARVCEPSIAMAYAMSKAESPVQAGAELLAGYHESLALGMAEIRVIPHLIAARLCVSVTMSLDRSPALRQCDDVGIPTGTGPGQRLSGRVGSPRLAPSRLDVQNPACPVVRDLRGSLRECPADQGKRHARACHR